MHPAHTDAVLVDALVARVTKRGTGIADSGARMNDFVIISRPVKFGHSRLRKRFESLVSSSLEQRLYEILTQQGLSISTAESCTGGLVSHRITTIPGSSAYFLGGIVAYSNDVKISLLGVPDAVLRSVGAVSSECALAMARGARQRIGSDVAVSTTGIAGPGGATETKPVGLVYTACSTPWGDVCEEHHFSGDRLRTIDESANAALSLVLEQVRKGSTASNH